MTFTIRPPEPAEHGPLGDLVVAAYDAIGANEDDDDYVPVLRDVERRAREAVVLAAVDDETGALLGCVTYVPDPANTLGRAAARGRGIDPDARRCARGPGQGRRHRARGGVPRPRPGRGASGVFLHSLPIMTSAQRIYERFGFRHVPERDWIFPDFLLLGFELDLA